MKLAEALQERADLNRRIAQLRSRLELNVLVQEGEQPPEDPKALFQELDSCVCQLEALMRRINLTNAATVQDGKTITELIARRDALSVKIQAYRSALQAASQIAPRAARTEIKILPSIDVRSLQKQTDDMAKELRQIDNTIQALNWSTELL